MVITIKPIGPSRKTSRATITLALFLAFAVTACAFPEEAFDGSLEGTYYINGFDHQGAEYGGSLTITATNEPSVYEMQWIITGSIQTGVATVSGNQLVAEWTALEGFDTASHGTATYEIPDAGELHGERVVDGQEGVGIEEALPVR